MRFRHLLQVPVPRNQQSFHVACEDQRFGQPPQDTQGSAEGECVHHQGSMRLRDEFMNMDHFLKRAADHLIHKPARPLLSGNL